MARRVHTHTHTHTRSRTAPVTPFQSTMPSEKMHSRRNRTNRREGEEQKKKNENHGRICNRSDIVRLDRYIIVHTIIYYDV